MIFGEISDSKDEPSICTYEADEHGSLIEVMVAVAEIDCWVKVDLKNFTQSDSPLLRKIQKQIDEKLGADWYPHKPHPNFIGPF